MKQVIIVVIVIIVFITLFLIFGSGTFEKEIDEYMYKKYGEHFTYIKEIDRGYGGDWSSHHIKSQNGDNVIVQYTKKPKTYRDNYYKIKYLDDIVLYVKNKFNNSINLQSFNTYKFYIDGNSSYCDEKINKDTKVEEALSMNSDYYLLKYIDIYIPEEEEKEVIEDDVFKYFEELKIPIEVMVLNRDDYNTLNADKNGYIYDYLVDDGVISGINSEYINFTLNSKVIYKSKIQY